MLSDEVYIGNLIQRVYSNRHDLVRKSKFRDKEEWIITKNTHEALIEKDIFEDIRQLKYENKGTLPYSSLKNVIKDGKENIGVKIQRDYTKEGKDDGFIK